MALRSIAQRALLAGQEMRMSGIINQFKSSTDKTVAEVERQLEVLTQQQGAVSKALNETQQLDARLKDLKENMGKYAEGRDVMVEQLQIEYTKLRTDTEFEFDKLKGEIEKWFELAKAHIDGQGTSGGFGKGSPHGKQKGVDKKEIAVWKLPEELDKAAFRHWVDAVDL